jgi:hypothetical protein
MAPLVMAELTGVSAKTGRRGQTVMTTVTRSSSAAQERKDRYQSCRNYAIHSRRKGHGAAMVQAGGEGGSKQNVWAMSKCRLWDWWEVKHAGETPEAKAGSMSAHQWLTRAFVGKSGLNEHKGVVERRR